MTALPTLRLRTAVNFPATVTGDGGILVTKDAGDFTITPAFGDLASTTTVAQPTHTYTWLYNSTSGEYTKISLDTLVEQLALSAGGTSFVCTVGVSTSDADPGAGLLTFNNSSQNSATTLYVDLADINGSDLTALLGSLDDSSSTVKGQISLTEIGNSGNRLVFTLSAVTTATGYRKLTVANVFATSSIPFTDGAVVLFQFVSNGDTSGETIALTKLNIDGGSALTAPDVADEVGLYDASATANKKITLANLWKVIDTLTGLTAPDTADELPIYDASGTATLKITLGNLWKAINTFTVDGTPDIASDYVATYDASATSAKKVLLNKLIVGKQTIGVAAGGLFPASSNGCAAVAQTETSSNKINYKYMAFDKTSIEYAWCWVPTPKSYNASTLTIRFNWTHPATTTNFGVMWQAEILSLTDDDAIDTAVGTAVTVTDTGGTTQDFYQSAVSGAITPSNTAAKQDWLGIRISRKASDAADTLNVDAHLIGVEVYYSTDTGTDD